MSSGLEWIGRKGDADAIEVALSDTGLVHVRRSNQTCDALVFSAQSVASFFDQLAAGQTSFTDTTVNLDKTCSGYVLYHSMNPPRRLAFTDQEVAQLVEALRKGEFDALFPDRTHQPRSIQAEG